jgi:hypothetical protein
MLHLACAASWTAATLARPEMPVTAVTKGPRRAGISARWRGGRWPGLESIGGEGMTGRTSTPPTISRLGL